MATRLIPTRTDQIDYTQTVSLDGVEYQFRFVWNQREEAWYLAISDIAGVSIVSGLKVVVGSILNLHVVADNAPKGFLFAVDSQAADTTPGIDPGINDLGDRVGLIYIDAEDVGR